MLAPRLPEATQPAAEQSFMPSTHTRYHEELPTVLYESKATLNIIDTLPDSDCTLEMLMSDTSSQHEGSP